MGKLPLMQTIQWGGEVPWLICPSKGPKSLGLKQKAVETTKKYSRWRKLEKRGEKGGGPPR